MPVFVNLKTIRESKQKIHEMSLKIWETFQEAIETNPFSETYTYDFPIEKEHAVDVRSLIEEQASKCGIKLEVDTPSSSPEKNKLIYKYTMIFNPKG